MRFLSLLALGVLALGASALHAQQAQPAPRTAAPSPVAAPSTIPAVGAPPSLGPNANAERPPWRQLSGYRFPALADTVSSLQNMSYAMQLRDYCADGRIEDDFVRDRLARFSQMTGREEDCSTLLRY